MSITYKNVWQGLDDRYEGRQRDKSGENLGLRALTVEVPFTSYVNRWKITVVLSSTECKLTITSERTREHTPRTFTAGYCRRANQKMVLVRASTELAKRGPHSHSEKTKRIVFGFCHDMKHVRRSIHSITVS